jgi:hypothetical protein
MLLDSTELEHLLLKRGTFFFFFPLRDTSKISRHNKLQVQSGHLELLCPGTRRQEEKSPSVGLINPHPQEEVKLLLHSKNKKEYTWNSDDSLRYQWILPCPTVTVNEQMPEKGIVLRPLRNESLGHTTNKQPKPTKIIAESKGYLD